MSFATALRLTGLLLLVAASHQLWGAAQHALTEGTVLLSDPRPSLPGRRGLGHPVPWQQAWSYFLGWALVGVASLILLFRAVSVGQIVTVGACLFFAFILIAVATMFGTLSGVLTWLAIFLAAVFVATAFALWKSCRDHRELSRLPEENDRDG